MRRRFIFIALLALFFMVLSFTSAQKTFAADSAPDSALTYGATPGPHEVSTLRISLQDPARNREIPLLICYPQDLPNFPADQKAPIILFSHGLGGSRDSYAAYGKFWASYGYVVVFPQHHGSDTGVIGHGMLEMLQGKNDTQPFLDRVADIHFLIDQLDLINQGKLADPAYAPLKNKLDMEKIGMSGHSFGAITTQAVEGEFSPLGASHLTEPRIKAAIAMSPSSAKSGILTAVALAKITIPTFFLTGTKDNTPNAPPSSRRVPFDQSTYPDTYLLTFNGAYHTTFVPPASTTHLLGPAAEKEKFQYFIRQATLAFWDAELKGDAKAKTWLTTQFAKNLGNTGTFEIKGNTPSK